MKEFDVYIQYAATGRIRLLENMKMVLYKHNPVLFELLDFDHDLVFNEPLLFAYFYDTTNKITLEQILYGHIQENKRPDSILAFVDNDGLIYLPAIGWLKTDLANKEVTISKAENRIGLSIFLNGDNVPFEFKPLNKIEGTPFELIPYQHPLLVPHFFDSKNNLVKVEIERITQTQKSNLSRALNLIKGNAPEFYQLLEESIVKLVIFNDQSVKRNSFATVSVHGCAFFNAFQAEYDEVFFVEDIAHQCGHVIFNNIIHNNKHAFKINPETIVKESGLFGSIVNLLEKRTLFVAFHALYTYYAISQCLEACILKSDLASHQKHEALGRFAYCYRKFENDIELLGKTDKNGESVYFTDLGMQLYKPIEETYKRIKNEWQVKFKRLNLLNQPYNFSNKNFFKSNPI